MKHHALCQSPEGLSLFNAAQNSIMSAREPGIGKQRHAQLEPVSNHALEHCSFLRADRGAAGCCSESTDRALPRLLATGLCADLSSWSLSNRRPGFNAGFFCDAT